MREHAIVQIVDEAAETANVPCNGCTACCRTGGQVLLQPHLGDDPALYETVSVEHPFQDDALALKQREDGSCIYLAADGCSIHASRPAICRSFDCRLAAAVLEDADPSVLAEMPPLALAVIQAGRERA